MAGGCKRGVAVAGGDVEHALAGAEVDRIAEALTDDLQCRADDGVVAGGPRRLLTLLDSCIVRCGKSSGYG